MNDTKEDIKNKRNKEAKKSTGSWEPVSKLNNVINFDEAGQETEGTFQRTFEHLTKKNDTIEMLELLNPSDEIDQIILCGSLKQQIMECHPGDRLKIVYNGEGECDNPKQPGEKTKFHDFKVYRWMQE